MLSDSSGGGVQLADCMHQTTIAFVPMENLIGTNSFLDKLKAEGYRISGP